MKLKWRKSVGYFLGRWEKIDWGKIRVWVKDHTSNRVSLYYQAIVRVRSEGACWIEVKIKTRD